MNNQSSRKILLKNELEPMVCVVVGTRPGIVKMSPVIREVVARGLPYFILHTGQHYSYEMDRKFFEDLELPSPTYILDSVRNFSTHGGQTARMIEGAESAFFEQRPRVVLVGGDANTNLCGALAARKLGLVVGHIEAGLRSYDWSMPEEHNRVIIDHISEFLFPPTEEARQNLLKDNVRGRIIVTGNTIVDALRQNSEIAKEKSDILRKLNLSSNGYFLATLHREENVDHYDRFSQIVDGLSAISAEYQLPVMFPVHPRTTKRLTEFGLMEQVSRIPNLRLIEPLGYLDFLQLMSHARLVLTDSGGIQEESCIQQVPCVTLRDNTERHESVDVGANVLAGVRPDVVLASVKLMLGRERRWPNPFGDGQAAMRIIDEVEKALVSDVTPT